MSQSHLPSQQKKSVFLNGTLLEGERFEQYCKQHGMCSNCGLVQTHKVKVKRFGMGRELVPITQKKGDKGDYDVYKGYCLQPTCYSLNQVKAILGEKPEKSLNKVQATSSESLMPEASVTSLDDREDHHQRRLSEPSVSEKSGGFAPSHSSATDPTPSSAPAATSDRSHGKMLFSAASRGDSADSDSQPRRARGTPDSTQNTTGVSLSDFVWNVPAPPLSSGSEQDEILESLQEDANAEDYRAFLTAFDIHHADLQVARKGIRMLRKMIVSSHGSETRKYVFPRDVWVKIMKSTAEANSKDVEIQEEIMLTWWYLCSLNEFYMREFMLHDCVGNILSALELGLPNVDVVSCGALECLTRDNQHGLSWGQLVQATSEGQKLTHDRCLSSVEMMATVVAGSGRGGKDLAIATLCNLAHQSSTANEYPDFLNSIQKGAPDFTQFLGGIVKLLNDENLAEHSAEDALSLLWRLASSDDTSNSESVSFRPMANDLLAAASSCMTRYDSKSICSLACGLISDLLVVCDTSGESVETTDLSTEKAIQSIVDAMSKRSDDASHQFSCLQTLSIILSKTERRQALTDYESCSKGIIGSMKAWQEDLDLQRVACRSLVYICSIGDASRDAVMAAGGLNAAMVPLRRFASDESPDAGHLRDEAYSVLGTMAASQSAALRILESEFMFDFESSLAGLSEWPVGMQNLVLAFVSATRRAMADASNSETSCVGVVSLLVQILFATESREMRITVLSCLHDLFSESETAVNAFLVASEGRAIDRVLEIMDETKEDMNMQINFCSFFVNIYARLAFSGEFDVPIQLDGESGPVIVTPHKAAVVSSVRRAMKRHKVNLLIVVFASATLSNFIKGSKGLDLLSWQTTEEVRGAFMGTFKDLIDALHIHDQWREEEKRRFLKTEVFGLARTLIHVSDDAELQRWSFHLLDKVTEEMSRDPVSDDILRPCVAILASLADGRLDERSLSDITGTKGVKGLYRCLRSDDDHLVGGALHVTALLLQRVFTFAGEILEVNHFIHGGVVSRMSRFPESALVQAEACSVLTHLAQLSDNFVVRAMSDLGILGELIIAIQRHRDNILVQERACKTIAAISPGLPGGVIASTANTLFEELEFTFETHRDVEGIQSAILETLGILCARKPEFVAGTVTGLGFIQQTIHSMNAHLPCEKIQNAGCSFLWTVGSYEDNKRVIGQAGGIRSIIAAILAHITSSSLQKEALTALKNMSMLPENKEWVALHDGTTAIRLAMWANIKDATVLSIGLSALNNVAVNPATKEVLPITEELLECILTAMSLHSNDIEVQKTSCFLLKSYTFNPSTLVMMRRNYEKITELLLLASTTFPDECEVRSQQIMRKLEG